LEESIKEEIKRKKRLGHTVINADEKYQVLVWFKPRQTHIHNFFRKAKMMTTLFMFLTKDT
jgi:hypothetical protein